MTSLEKMDAHYQEKMSTPPVKNSIEGIKNALNLFVLVLQLCEATGDDRLKADILKQNITLYTDDVGRYDTKIHVGATYTQKALAGNMHNLLLSTLMTCAIAADVAMEDFGKRCPEATDNLNAARNILYQIRCAFAHGPYLPKWHILEKYQQEYVFEFESIQIKFNGKNISKRTDQRIIPADFGGYEGFICLLKFCQKSLEDKLSRPQE